MNNWEWHQSCVSIRNNPAHRRQVIRMSTQWLESHPTSNLRSKVLDILHWDYDVKPYTLDDLLKMPRDPKPEVLMEALRECGYTEREALMRCTVCESRRKEYKSNREGVRYRSRKCCRGGARYNESYTKSTYDRRQENYLDAYSVNVPSISPTIYRPSD